MKNRIRVLIDDNSVELGMTFSKYLSNMGCETMCRRSGSRQLYDEIVADKPDVVMLSISSYVTGAEELSAQLKSDFPNIKIIALSYISSRSLCCKLLEAGVDRCILMPASMREIYRTIVEISESGRVFEFEAAISGFLASRGFPLQLSGLRYLCTCVGYSLVNPDYISDITKTLYKKVAEAYNVTPDIVERSLRNAADVILKTGVDKQLLGSSFIGNRRLTNYELICAAADAFAKEYGIFD